MKKPLPNQDEANMGDPEEHLLWALRNMPAFAGSGVITHPGFLRQWSKHLYDAGFRHHPDEQKIFFREAFRGPHHIYNNAARWVSKEDLEPVPYKLPNVAEMTLQEKYALAYMLKQQGVSIPEAPKPVQASVYKENEE